MRLKIIEIKLHLISYIIYNKYYKFKTIWVQFVRIKKIKQ